MCGCVLIAEVYVLCQVLCQIPQIVCCTVVYATISDKARVGCQLLSWKKFIWVRIEVHSILIMVERRTKAKKFLWSKTIGAFRITRLLLVMSPNVPTKVSCSHLWTNKINCNPKSIDKLPSGFYLRSEVSRDGLGPKEGRMECFLLVWSIRFSVTGEK